MAPSQLISISGIFMFLLSKILGWVGSFVKVIDPYKMQFLMRKIQIDSLKRAPHHPCKSGPVAKAGTNF